MKQEKIDVESLTQMQKEHNWAELLSVVAFVGALILFSLFYSSNDTVALQVKETDFRICADDGTAYSIAYAEVMDVTCAENVEFGSCVEGTETRSVKSGRWRNQSWGEYFLCASGTIDTCVVITTEKGVFVFNCQSDETTRAISEELRDWVAQKQTEN